MTPELRDPLSVKPDISQGHIHTKVNVGPGSRYSATIASGLITPSADRAWMVLDTEGAAATDDLDGLAIRDPGEIILLSTNADARDITLRHNQSVAAGYAPILTEDAQSITLSNTRAFARRAQQRDSWRTSRLRPGKD